MSKDDYRHTSIRIHKKINSRLEEIREVIGCSMNSLCVAMLDKYSRLLMQNRDLSNKKDRETLLGEIQHILEEVSQ